MFLDYINERAREPCGKSVPLAILASLTFMEKKGGISTLLRISADEYVLNTVDSVTAELARDAPLRKKAPRFLVMMIISLELYVVGEAPTYKRFIAWTRLVKLWCVFRYDDHRGMVMSRLMKRQWGLEGMLERTKTSGPGKRVQVRPFFLSQGFYHRCTLGAHWLGHSAI